MSLQADLINASEELATKRTRLADMFRQRDAETDPAKRDEIGSAIKSANAELAPLNDKVAGLQDLTAAAEQNNDALKALRQPVGRQVDLEVEAVNRGIDSADDVLSAGHKSIREILTASAQQYGLKSLSHGGRGFRGFRGDLGELAVKTLITSADLTPLEERRTGIVPTAQEERTVADLMLSGTTTAQKITYYVETTYTNAAVETAEAGPKQESALDFTLREDDVRKIATWVPVTDEMLEDVPTFESYLRARLGFMVRQREELQLLQGAGTGITIEGLYNRTDVQVQTGIGISTIDSILSAITKIQANAFVEPTAMVIHPLDWYEVRTRKDNTGNYLLGPATLDPDLARPWGLRVRVTTNAIENTALVGAFNQAQVFRRSGISIAISTEHADYFVYNKLAVRAEERLALAVYRPDAFCKVQGIVQGS